MKKPVVIVAVALAVIAVCVVVLFMFVLPGQQSQEPAVAPVYVSSYSPGETFYSNIKDSYQLIRVKVVLELDVDPADEEFFAEMISNNHIIRDTILLVLRSMTEEEYHSPESIEVIRAEIAKKINERLGFEHVNTVYFDDYVIQ